MGKEVKTNAMRILDKNKIPYEILNYECGEFIDGLHTAEATGAPVEQSFKTLVMQGKSRQYYVFVIPIADEVDLKAAARAVGEKSVEMIHVKDITAITGYVRGGCSPLGMKKQFPTIVHESAAAFDKIYISGGRIGTSITINPDSLLTVVRGQYADVIRFYPILVGHEGESWKRLLEEAFPKLLAGSFDAKYQKELNQAFERNLGVHADSE